MVTQCQVKLFWRAVVTVAATVVNYPCYVYDHSDSNGKLSVISLNKLCINHKKSFFYNHVAYFPTWIVKYILITL